MRLSKSILKQLIKEELELHFAPDDLASMDPHVAYGLGYQAKADYDLKEYEKTQLAQTIQEELRILLAEEEGLPWAQY